MSAKPTSQRALIVPGLLHQTSTNRIPEDVPDDNNQPRGLDWTREEPTLEEVASPPLTEVDHAGVALVRFADTLGEATRRGRDSDQVNVIRHQAPSKLVDTVGSALLREKLEIRLAIFIAEEDTHSADSSLRAVVRKPRDDDASYAGHVMSLS